MSSALHDAAARTAAELQRRLDGRRSPLTADPVVAAQLAAQVHAVLRRTGDRLGLAVEEPAVAGPEVGRTRARQNIHPVDSLTAATLLFDIAVGELVALGLPELEVARALNAAIMADVVPASVSYVDVLLERLAVAHREERLGISRELHDRVAHGIAAALQRIRVGPEHPHPDGDVADGAPADGRAGADRLEEAVRLLEAALDETRSLALDLRHSVGDKHLDEAIADYVADLGSDRPVVFARSEGTPRLLSSGVQEEAFIIVREAIHNARRHSAADRIHVTSSWLADALVVTIEDDGSGFERDRIRPGALGLIAAQERAELIGADLIIATEPGAGTTLTLTIGHPEGRG